MSSFSKKFRLRMELINKTLGILLAYIPILIVCWVFLMDFANNMGSLSARIICFIVFVIDL